MKVLAFLSAANLSVFPTRSPELAVLTVLALATGWLLWPVVELIGGIVE